MYTIFPMQIQTVYVSFFLELFLNVYARGSKIMCLRTWVEDHAVTWRRRTRLGRGPGTNYKSELRILLSACKEELHAYVVFQEGKVCNCMMHCFGILPSFLQTSSF